MPTCTDDVSVQEGKCSEGHQIYKFVWTPVISEELHAKLEKVNKYVEHTVAVIFDGLTVGHCLAAASFKIFSTTSMA